ncbi:MAG: hypothetical protein HY900_17210 [Deltaproteobacteria bacterium]|nr:hypothetical protein [Deltaproteobacteria bacterium]
MKKTVIAIMGFSLLFSGAAFAKGAFVKGAKCKACHVGSPSEKKLTEKAQEMVKKHKVEECKDCHGAAEGDKDMTTTKKE